MHYYHPISWTSCRRSIAAGTGVPLWTEDAERVTCKECLQLMAEGVGFAIRGER